MTKIPIMKEYMIKFILGEVREEICDKIVENGAYYCGELKVPCWNIGKTQYNHFVIVYQHTEKIDFGE